MNTFMKKLMATKLVRSLFMVLFCLLLNSPQLSLAQMNYDFEDGTLQGWTTIDADGDGHDWIIIAPATLSTGNCYAHSGDYCASSWSWDNVSYDPDNYLVSPICDNVTSIQYFVATNTGYPDHYALMVSSTGTNPSNFSMIFEETVGSSKKDFHGTKSVGIRDMSEWFERNIALPVGTKYVAFRHYNSYDMNYLLVDDVTIGGSGPVPPVVDLYDFEDSTLQGWTSIDANNDGYDWVLGSQAGGIYLVTGGSLYGTGHNSSADMICSGSYSNVTNQAITPDNYIVSPQVTLGGSFSFYACAQDAAYPSEHFGVAVSTTNNTSASAFTTIQEWTMTAKGAGVPTDYTRSGNRTQGNWYQFTVDLSAYAGQTGYVAIRHFNCTDMFILNVDDITLGGSLPSTCVISVSASPTNGGTVTGGGNYSQGQSCTVSASAASGYTFLRWTENGNQVSTNANYTFNVTGNRTLVAQFQPQSYSVVVSANPPNGGIVTGNGSYTYGQSCTVSATAAMGYTFLRWTENGNQVSTNANYTFNVTGNRTLVAVFQSQSYTVSASANPSNGGMLTGYGTYSYGQSCTLTASPNNGFVFDRWTTGGTTVSTNPAYSFTVTGNVAYVAHFSQSVNNYTITTYADPIAGGTVSGGGTYEQGTSCTLTATPNDGYGFVNWTKEGNPVSTDPVLQIVVAENAIYVAHFFLESNEFTIVVNANPSAGGVVNGGGIYSIDQTCMVTAVANEGYFFENWTENGSIVSLEDRYSFVVDGNRNLYANFTKSSSYFISASAGANGSISPQGDIEVPVGGDQTFTITPDFGCRISNVLVDGVDLGPLETYTFSNVNSNHTISAVFSGWGIEESQAAGIMLFPNPTKDFITVKGQGIARIQVFNLRGVKVLDVNVNKEGGNVSLKNLSSGTYVVLITLQNGKQSYSKIVLSN